MELKGLRKGKGKDIGKKEEMKGQPWRGRKGHDHEKKGRGKDWRLSSPCASMRQHAPAQFNKKPERKQNERKDEKGRELPDAIQIEDKGKDTQVEGRIKNGKNNGGRRRSRNGKGEEKWAEKRKGKERKGGRRKEKGKGEWRKEKEQE